MYALVYQLFLFVELYIENKMQSYKIINIVKTIHLVFLLTLFVGTPSWAQKNTNHVLKTIVIDAGHGGKDPGTHGGLTNEKAVCLAIALKLGAVIKKNYPDIKVIFTRDKDVFVELDERAKIANRNKADLFICIHANSASPAAYGAETYVLGLHRTEAQLKIAEKENSSIYLEDDKGAKYKDFDLSPDAIIFKQLQMSTYLDLAIKFATYLQGEFKSLGRYDRGVKQAGFLVLYKTTMPSVLIETGFLTNHEEERFLADEKSQEKMAHAMFVAIQKYKNELEGKQINKDISPTVVYKPQNQESNINKDDVSDNDIDLNNKVIYRVQISTSAKNIATTSSIFKGLPIFVYQQGGLYKYTSGEFINDFEQANEYKNKMRDEGFENAFVVAFYNNERIDLTEALKHSK